jgi:hypothetical protein
MKLLYIYDNFLLNGIIYLKFFRKKTVETISVTSLFETCLK